ncbi:helix-turn-helix domain-containing protein [Paenibacillus chartarius]|uniref:Helix-turn-helix domain-containing protein n=1 Tax=Paenibacillus chartarius TaxID=747481 RepID=A0ABV6DVP8_9BACL
MNTPQLKEDRIHGSPQFPVSVYEITCEPGQQLLELHWHDELEFLMITEGRAVMRVNLSEYELGAGEAVFVNGGELHSGTVADASRCSFRAVVFHADLLSHGPIDPVQERYVRPLLRRQHVVPVRLTGDSEEERSILQLLDQVFEINHNAAPVYEMMTRGLLQLMVAKLIAMGERRRQQSVSPAEELKLERLKLVIEYIQEHYSRPIRLSELAALVRVNASYLCRFFKEMTTFSPLDYLNQVRVQKAAGLLKEGRSTVMSVALEVGFHSQSYFITVFKRYFGVTPSEYRKREGR